MPAKVAYLVHDLTDAAVWRRVRMLELGGAEVSLAGFRRGLVSTAKAVVPVLDLGRTRDARLVWRAASVVRALTQITSLRETVSGADIVIARNLEMLPIASRARAIFAPDAKLIYECLDIHRLLLSRGPIGKFLHAIEAALWRDVDTILTSSPAFVEHYFASRQFGGKIEIVENKILEGNLSGIVDSSIDACSYKYPWKIAYCGIIRCRKSLYILRNLTEISDGKIEVILRGKFSPAVFPDINIKLRDGPAYMRYLGPYNSDTDIQKIYREVHFAWAIDFYEESQNSSWLLPNRLYESSYAGAVPIALESVETGRWLMRHNAGVTLREPVESDLRRFFAKLDGAAYEEHAARVGRIPRRALAFSSEDCSRLVALLKAGRRAKAQERMPQSLDREA